MPAPPASPQAPAAAPAAPALAPAAVSLASSTLALAAGTLATSALALAADAFAASALALAARDLARLTSHATLAAVALPPPRGASYHAATPGAHHATSLRPAPTSRPSSAWAFRALRIRRW